MSEDMTAREKVSEDRIRNYRAWCEARVGSLSGADIGVALCDEVLRLRTSQEWVDVRERLPKCSTKPNSFGTQVLIFPPYESEGSSPAHVAFYGRRVSDEPNFYLYGRCIDVTHWQPLPTPPKGDL